MTLQRKARKVGDRREPKGRNGPARRTGSDTDASASPTKAHLYDLAKRFDVPGRSSMTKAQLAEAVARARASRRRVASTRYSAGF
ncbi:hypothetical protein AB0I60_07205 [Actinosynnema sp. NPDC050436]|uniref:hypothetical protein n=1 Tax=Actinosynnema sp. NPDC050436 TaxID=3155659 RepID=UPI0033C6184F